MADLVSPQPRNQSSLFFDPQSGSAAPLWFSPSSFLSDSFSPSNYISSLKSFVPLPSLAQELRAHLSSLKSKLVDLINRDYAEFVSLSTRMVDVNSSVARMRAPVLEFRGKVVGFREEVSMALESLKDGLRERAEVEKARGVLELLLDTFHVVSKVEKLIMELPSVPADGSTTDNVPEDKGLFVSDPVAEDGMTTRETQSILLERIASEMNRLKFYFSNAKDLPFIKNMEKRIQSAMHVLDGSLGHCFVNALEHRDANAIYNCLRAYAAIDNTSAAEENFRKTIVAPLIQEIIPYGQNHVVDGSSSDELEADYEKIRQSIEKNCNFLLEISSSANSGLHVFDFLGNSILKEVLLAIQKGKPGAFSPGRPTEFLKNYKSSLSFLTYLEGHCPSTNSVTKLRSSTVYGDFMRQWNVGVYFSLRFQEIAGSLDSSLTATSITPVKNEQTKNDRLTLQQSIILLESLRACWSDDVIVIFSSDKFLRLSLQLLSRYSTWLSSGLAARKEDSKQSNTQSNTEWAISARIEDFIYVIHDLQFLVNEIEGDYLAHVLGVLESCPAEVLDLVKQSILQAKKSLGECLPAVMDTIIEAIVKLSVEDLRQLKGITATFRMSNKVPVRHSSYVLGILRPLKTFLEGEHINLLTESNIAELKLETARRITTRYYDLAADVVNVAKKTEVSLQRLRQGAQRRGGNSDTGETTVSDTDKICMQLFLDIKEYGRNLVAMGIQVASIRNIQPLRSFWQLVAPEDKQAELDTFAF